MRRHYAPISRRTESKPLSERQSSEPGAGSAGTRAGHTEEGLDQLARFSPPSLSAAKASGVLLGQVTTGTMSTEELNGLTEEQEEILECNFCKGNKYPDPTTLLLIAAEVGLSEEQTEKWFKRRLAQWRKSEGLPSECGSVTD